MGNFLEQLVAEWYEFRGYFIRRNVKVGKRPNGGYDSEFDIVAFNPISRHLVHVEPSMDCDSWTTREKRFRAKFDAGQKHIPGIFDGFSNLPDIEHLAIFVYGSTKNHTLIGNGRIVPIKILMDDIHASLANLEIRNAAVPEHFTILWSLQFAANFWTLN